MANRKSIKQKIQKKRTISLAGKKVVKMKARVKKQAVSASAPRVLVLGVTGMLGSMVYRYLRAEKGLVVSGTVRDKKQAKLSKNSLYYFDAESYPLDEKPFREFKPDYVINCIGVIKPHCKDDDHVGSLRAIRLNAHFPHSLRDLAERFHFRVVQIATDCVYSGVKGMYIESDAHDALDVYGKSKSLGEVRKGPVLNIRTSIIGPEEKGKLSLLEWFLAQKEGSVIKGFAHHRWNGVTTLQFAELVREILGRGNSYFDELVATSPVHHFVPNSVVDKHELMNIFVDTFGRNLTVERVDSVGPAVDRTLATKFAVLPGDGSVPMKDAIAELAAYMRVHRIFPYA
jgi:dTDP-4-dehydrorhamnose reductase